MATSIPPRAGCEPTAGPPWSWRSRFGKAATSSHSEKRCRRCSTGCGAGTPSGSIWTSWPSEPVRVENKVNDFAVSVLQAVVIVLGCMLLMLGLRTGLVVAALVPCALLTSLLVMRWLDLGLNQMTLASLIIALGMLVDNAIVMSESIMVAMSHGTPRVQAAVQSANELRVPLLTSSLTTSAAFLPIYVAEGSMGEYTGVLFVVVTIALLSSWLLSLTVVPLLCARFLRVPAAEPGHDYTSLFFRAYRGLLLAMVRIPLLSAAVTVVVFLVSLWGFSRVPKVFFPRDDTPMMTAEFKAPIGTSIEETLRFAEEFDGFVRDELAANPERPGGVVNWSTYVGQGAPRFTLTYGPQSPSPEYAYGLFNLTTAGILPDLARKIERFCEERHPSVTPSVTPLSLGSVIRKPVEIRVSGNDRNQVFAIADDVKNRLRSIEGSRNVDDDWGEMTKKLTVGVDAVRAKRNGVTHRDIAVSLRSILSGYKATEYREGSEIIPVTIRSVDAGRQDISKLESLNVFSQSRGTSVPLMQVADLALGWQPAKLLRRNRLTTVTVSSELADGATAAEVTGQVAEWLQETSPSWPAGIFYEIGGEAEESARSEGAIMDKLPYSVLLIIILLVAQFNSIRRSLIVLLTIPLALVGTVIGLLVTADDFGFMTLLGLISLAGIVINNAIVLLDRIRIEIREKGRTPPHAVIEASQAPAASHPADHGHHHRWTPAPLVRRRPHVGVHGDRGDLRPVVRNDPHPGRGAGALHAPVSGEVQGFPLRIGGGAHGVPKD